MGVDTNKDGKVNQWTKWQETKENYDYVKGFSKRVAKTPAKLALSDLPKAAKSSGLTDTTTNASKPLIEALDTIGSN